MVCQGMWLLRYVMCVFPLDVLCIGRGVSEGSGLRLTWATSRAFIKRRFVTFWWLGGCKRGLLHLEYGDGAWLRMHGR